MAEPIERRKGNIAHIIDTFIGKQSRKVAFGIWGFIAANALIQEGKIDMRVYVEMFFTCAALIGFGTILDDILRKLGDKLADKAAGRISAVTSTIKTETTVTEAAPQ
jgi:hypothetical protein